MKKSLSALCALFILGACSVAPQEETAASTAENLLNSALTDAGMSSSADKYKYEDSFLCGDSLTNNHVSMIAIDGSKIVQVTASYYNGSSKDEEGKKYTFDNLKIYETTSTGTVSKTAFTGITGYTDYAIFTSYKSSYYNFETGGYDDYTADYTSYYALKIETSKLTAYYVSENDGTYTVEEYPVVYTKI